VSGRYSESLANCERCGSGRRASGAFHRLLLLLLMVFVLTGCGSSTRLETSNAVSNWALLKTACSAEDAVRLEVAAKALDAAHQANDITENEHKLLLEVVAKAREKNWKEALALCQEIHSLAL
jgi:hypothetical protein